MRGPRKPAAVLRAAGLALGVPLLLAAAALSSACRCGEGRQVRGVPDAAPEPAPPRPDRPRADASPTKVAEQPAAPGVPACKAVLRAPVEEPADRGRLARSECSILFVEARCRRALQGMEAGPEPEEVVSVLRACAEPICERLAEAAPPLCRADLDRGSLARPITYEWARLGGDAIAASHEVPLAWARNAAFAMSSDWLPPDAPPGPEPVRRLRAALEPRAGGGSLLRISTDSGDPVGEWGFADREDRDDVEEALASVEPVLRGARVDLQAAREVEGMTIVRVRTGMLFLGARPVSPLGGG